jgi:ATP-dependent DNA ligase
VSKNIQQIDMDDALSIANDCLIELKIDGSRMTFNGTSMFSDRDVNRDARYPHVLEELRKIDWVCRGEMAIPGGNILQLNKKINWHKAKIHIFDLYEYEGQDLRGNSPRENRWAIEDILRRNKLQHITAPELFTTFQEGWQYVCDNSAEGLVLKELANHPRQYKIKKLVEEKLPIVDREIGKAHGTFILMRDGVRGKVSGTSTTYVAKYEQLLSEGEVPHAEIEYQFLTEYGVPFQPRLRRLDTLANLNS